MKIRPGVAADHDFLEAMLFEAFFWDKTAVRPPLAVFRADPEFTKLLGEWDRFGDRAVVGEEQNRRVGAAWFRLWTPEVHSYGFVDVDTPELAIAVESACRGRGIGRALLEALIVTARADGFPALSLSVNPLNSARHLYESLGFRKVGQSGTAWTLRLGLGS